jgi:hypothetical protein
MFLRNLSTRSLCIGCKRDHFPVRPKIVTITTNTVTKQQLKLADCLTLVTAKLNNFRSSNSFLQINKQNMKREERKCLPFCFFFLSFLIAYIMKKRQTMENYHKYSNKRTKCNNLFSTSCF